MHEGPTKNRLGELGSLYKYYYYIIIIIIIIIIISAILRYALARSLTMFK